MTDDLTFEKTVGSERAFLRAAVPAAVTAIAFFSGGHVVLEHLGANGLDLVNGLDSVNGKFILDEGTDWGLASALSIPLSTVFLGAGVVLVSDEAQTKPKSTALGVVSGVAAALGGAVLLCNAFGANPAPPSDQPEETGHTTINYRDVPMKGGDVCDKIGYDRHANILKIPAGCTFL